MMNYNTNHKNPLGLKGKSVKEPNELQCYSIGTGLNPESRGTSVITGDPQERKSTQSLITTFGHSGITVDLI